MNVPRIIFVGCWSLLFILDGCWAERVSYKGYRVIRIFPDSQQQLHKLNDIINANVKLDVWRRPSHVNSSVDLNVSPSLFPSIRLTLDRAGIKFQEVIKDVQVLIDQQKVSPGRGKNDAFDYEVYHPLNEIHDWVYEMAAAYPTMASTFEVADSYEDRKLLGLKISTGPGKEGFWLEGGIHAREWISPATLIFIAAEMLTNYTSSPEVAKVVDMFDWYILPVTNPDGYVYTHTTERLWRKTRSIQAGTSCVGVDPNRNWDSEWCKEGASNNPCSDTYCGPRVFSESEVKGVSEFVSTHKPMRVFIDVHSYSQYWMTPWGHSTTHPPDFKVEDDASTVATDALTAVYGTKYTHGTIAEVIYIASGSSVDWAYDAEKIKFSFAVELRDTGFYGFTLPADQIKPSGEETFVAILALAEFVNKN